MTALGARRKVLIRLQSPSLVCGNYGEAMGIHRACGIIHIYILVLASSNDVISTLDFLLAPKDNILN